MSSPRASSPFRVLSLDGGGIRGAFTAAFLAEVERQVGRPIGEFFDLFAGTSTGAIIAGGLALGMTAEELEQLYLEKGARIFTRLETPKPKLRVKLALKVLRKTFPQLPFDEKSLFYAKYDRAELELALEERFGDRTFGDAGRRVVIPTVDLIQGKVVVFKTPHLPGLFRDRSIRVRDAVVASAAAPTYFPHAVIGEGSAYCDGGLWANNPSVVAFAEAARIRATGSRETDPRFELDDVELLSVGTGDQRYFAPPPDERAGFMWWAPRLFDVVGVSQSQGVDFQSQYLLGERYKRIDFKVPTDGWKLDAVEFLDRLIHLGRERAAQTLEDIRGRFFAAPASEPVWFPVPTSEAARVSP